LVRKVPFGGIFPCFAASPHFSPFGFTSNRFWIVFFWVLSFRFWAVSSFPPSFLFSAREGPQVFVYLLQCLCNGLHQPLLRLDLQSLFLFPFFLSQSAFLTVISCFSRTTFSPRVVRKKSLSPFLGCFQLRASRRVLRWSSSDDPLPFVFSFRANLTH